MRERQSPSLPHFLPRALPRPRRYAAALLAACAAIALTGCGNEDANSAAIQSASYRLDALSPRSVAAASDDYVAQQCQQIIQDLRPVASGGNATQKAAAQGLIARAQVAIAFPKVKHANTIQSQMQGEIEIARSLYDRLLIERALETAANNYDAAPELADIEAELARVAELVTAAQTAKARVDAVVSSLRAKAGSKRSESRSHRAAEAALRQEVLTTEDEDEAARLMVKTQEARRNADALDVEASDLEAQADRQAPESSEIERQIQRFQNQTALLRESHREVMERSQQAKEDAATAAADAAETHSVLATALTNLGSTYTSALLPAIDDAVSTLSQASSAASQARNVISSVKAVQSEAQQSIGNLQWAAAELSDAYAGLTGRLAQTSPPLPGLGDLAAANEQASEAFTARLRLAAQALNIAADALDDEQVADALRARADTFSARAGDPVTPPDAPDPFEDDPMDPMDPDHVGEMGDEIGG